MKKEELLNKLYSIRDFTSRYAVMIFVFSFVAVTGYLTFQIATLSSAEPSEAQQDERRQELKKVTLNKENIAKLEALQDQNVTIESIFDNGRENPFE